MGSQRNIARPWWQLLLAGLLLIAAAGVSLLLLGDDTVERAADPAPTPGNCAEVETFAGREDCLRDLLAETTRTSGAQAAASRLAELLDTHPKLREVCHQPTHVVAEQLPTPTLLELSGYIRSSAMQVCDWGLIHGFLFRYAASASGAENLTEVLGVCTSLTEPSGQVGCANAVGYSLYEFTEDFPTAAGLCETEEAVLRDCVNGVFIQFFSPVAPSDRGEAVGSSLPLTEIPELCALASRDVAAACYRASHYAYSQVLGPIRYEMSRAEDPTDLFEKEFLPAYEEGAAFCLSFPEYGGYGCAEELSRMALQLLVPFDDPTLLDEVCAATPSAAAEFCRFAKKSLLG